jgi:DNA-binding NarL/FixJ family response regulator
MDLPRVMIADDHKLLTQALHTFLADSFEIVGEVSDGRALLEIAPQLKPDVVVVDVGMPLLNGLDASRQLKLKMPSVKIIFMTQYADPDIASQAMRLGASGYILKEAGCSELSTAINAALRGRTFITPKIARSMEAAFVQNPVWDRHKRPLTSRQREVVQLLAEGKSMKEAGYILNVSRRTIAFHKYRIMENLGLRSTAELVQFAIDDRLLVPGTSQATYSTRLALSSCPA